MKLMVHSGNCCLCEIGINTGVTDHAGREVHTGDVVSLYSLVNGDDDYWELVQPLTVVVCNQFQSFSDGTVKLIESTAEFFTMGIKSIGIASDEWRVSIAKKFHDVVPGEHWSTYGFSYRENEAAKAAIAKAEAA